MMQPAQPQPQTPQQRYIPPQADGKATASMVLGILSVTCFGLLAGIPAVILGHISRKNIRESRGRLTGDGKALAGMIMGYVSIALVPVILIIAAIAIPSLLRSRMAANSSAAASTIRTVNTAQVEYLTRFNAGYAKDLATLGSGGGDCSSSGYPSAQHACMIDGILGSPTCTGANWCAKTGYKFSMTAICDSTLGCAGYVITATPLNPGATGLQDFCAASDAVVRSRRGPPLSDPLDSEDACKRWQPVL